MSCRAILLFALRREGAPLVHRPGVQRASLQERDGKAFVQSIPDDVDYFDAMPDDVIFDYTGVGRAAARTKLEELLTPFPRPAVVIAAGFCGALRGPAAVGDVVVPAEVIDESGHAWACHAIPGSNPAGRLLTSSRVIGDVAGKAAAARKFEADFVDMESAGIAEACEAHAIPFAAVRAVSDTADTSLSPRLAGLLSASRVSLLKLVWAIMRQPSLIGELRRLAWDTGIAAGNLAEQLRKSVIPGPRSG